MDFDMKYNILDTTTPRHTLLSAKYKKSCAYYVMRERFPNILTQMISGLTKEQNEIANQYEGEKSRQEIKEIIGKLARLKIQLQTDKVFEKFDGLEPDKELWNTFIDSLDSSFNTFFHSSWLFAEFYLYRKIASFFENSATLKSYDYFFTQKINSLKRDEVVSVAKRLRNAAKNFETFARVVKLSLWANRYDLSIIIPKDMDDSENFFDNFDRLNANILLDDSKSIWKCLEAADRSKPIILDYVLDNAGFELYTDLLLADYLLSHKMVTKIRFHYKSKPSYISDATAADLDYIISYLGKHESNYVIELGRKWKNYLAEGIMEMAPEEHFWISPYEYYKMRELHPYLYKLLGEAHLIIFKGDVHYRKLLGDMNWDTTDDFLTCLRGFQPANFCVLRTVKADLICGMKQGKAEALSRHNPTWMVTGEYGVIHFMEGNLCKCNILQPASQSE